MNLVDETGRPMNADSVKPQLVDVAGEAISSEEPKPMSTADVGAALATHMITKACALPNNELINKQFDVLFHAALNLLAHRIVNVGLGMEAGNAIAEWDSSRAFAYEKEVQEALTATVENWKTQFFNGELYYNADKKD